MSVKGTKSKKKGKKRGKKTNAGSFRAPPCEKRMSSAERDKRLNPSPDVPCARCGTNPVAAVDGIADRRGLLTAQSGSVNGGDLVPSPVSQ